MTIDKAAAKVPLAVEDVVMAELSQNEVDKPDVQQDAADESADPRREDEGEELSSEEDMASELDEDDLDLLEHTLGRKKTKDGFSRLQRRLDSGDETEAQSEKEGVSEESDDEAVIGMKRKGKSNLDKLFDDSDEEEVRPRESVEDEDDLDDFIEDDMAEAAPTARVKKAQPKGSRKKPDYARFGTGLSRDVLQDLIDIFGDGTEYADMVDDETLASDLDDLHLTDARKSRSGKASPAPASPADIIKETDVPERYQNSAVVPLDEGELEQEAVWISTRLLPFIHERLAEVTVDRLIPVVGAVVSLIRNSLLEVPFIATHRKEYFQHLLGLTDLWRILDFDEEWRALSRQKSSFASYMAAKNDPVDITIDEAVQDIGDLEFYQDYYKQVIRFGTGPRARSAKPIYNQLLPFARSFALEPQEFLMNWANKEQRHQPRTPAEEPGLAAVQYVNEEMPSETAILRDVSSLAALELAFHPKTNRMFRSALEAVSCVSVTPTALGQREIGMNHDLAGFKYLAEKPVASFAADGDLYLRLVKAEKAGLIQLSLVFRRMTELESEWSEFYGASGSDEEWTGLRKKILYEAIHDHLIPRVKRIIQGRLTRQAEQFVAQGCQYALQAKLMQAPFSPGLAGIMAISWGDGSPQAATMCVRLDANGRVIDQARFVHLQEGPNRNHDEWERLYSFVHELQPALIIVGGTSVRTVELYDGLRASFRHGNGPRVVFGEDDAARLYQDSTRAQLEFPEYGGLLRYCVSLGRRWINPLFELAAAGDSLLKMPLHPTQAAITVDLLSRHIERALVNVTNLVGLDSNTLAANPWARAPLRYISGLGPLKAEQLAQQIQRRLSGRADTRADLSTLLGPVVYVNVCSFLRVVATKDGKEKQWPTEPLDTTRIHPENYPLARKIACDATEMTYESSEEEEEVGRRAVIAAMKQPERLNDLLLEEYARELEKRLQLPKHLTLLDIKAELQAPYADLRTVVDETPSETVFESLTGETESSLFVGQQVQAKVLRITDRAAICRLESGLTGHLSLKNLPAEPSTGRPPTHPGRVLRPNQAVLAAVIDIHLTRFEVTLSLHPDDLKEPRRPRSGDFDPYYDHEAAKNLQKRRRGFTSEASGSSSAGAPKPAPHQRRQISHPCYKEVSRLEAERLLSSAVLGEVIVRPSGSHGAGHLAMTWKVDQCDQGGLYQHVDIEEKDRPADAYGALGRSLNISLPDGSRQTMEDLDELIARYVEPIASYLQDIRTCPKFLAINSLDKTGARSAVEAHLATERSHSPGRIAYCVSLSRDKPGAALLSYQPSTRCHHELVDVLPSGFRLRGVSFERLEALINWFKHNYNRR